MPPLNQLPKIIVEKKQAVRTKSLLFKIKIEKADAHYIVCSSLQSKQWLCSGKGECFKT